MVERIYDGFIPGRHPIEGYGAGGFRFAGISHRGTILALPSGIHALTISRPEEIDEAALAPLFDEPKGAVDFLLLGTGASLALPSRALRAALKARGVGVDPMATGHALSTYNILLGEGRKVAALLLGDVVTDACETIVREREKDVWLAALFLPQETRRAVFALHAFDAEIARIRDIVSQPTLGEIRLQWWREVIEGARSGEGASHPVAAALLETVARWSLPPNALTGLIEARRFDLYDDPMASLNDLEGYCGETWSALFRLSAIAAAGGEDPGGADATGYAGVAWGLARLLRDLPRHAARGQCFLPRDVLAAHGALPEAAAAGLDLPALRAALADLRAHARRRLAQARAARADLAPAARGVLLPLAVVEPTLARMERRGYAPFADDVELPQWRRQWALWRAARTA